MIGYVVILWSTANIIRGIHMPKKFLLSAAAVIIINILLAVVLSGCSMFSFHTAADDSKNQGADSVDLFYEIWIDGKNCGETDDLDCFFEASGKVEALMSERLGHPYTIGNDLLIKLIAVRKSANALETQEIYQTLLDKTTSNYEECFAFYVGSEIVGYCPTEAEDSLQNVTVDIVNYLSQNTELHAGKANVYAAPSYAHKDNIVDNAQSVSDILEKASSGDLDDGEDDTLLHIIESIDKAITNADGSTIPGEITPIVTVTTVRRVETEVIKFQKIRRPDTYYGLVYGDDDEFVHIKGSNGECTVEYEDIYIGGELSETIRHGETEIITVPVTNEVTVYGTRSTYASTFKSKGDFAWPTVGWITSEYGPRDAEFAGMSTYHKGIDISTTKGTAIVAAAPGKVVFAGWHSGGFGYCVIIDHENGYKTLYAHMYKKPCVSEGDRVYQGEKLGGQGRTGSANGVHLHFELIKVSSNGDESRINPRNFLPKGSPATKW